MDPAGPSRPQTRSQRAATVASEVTAGAPPDHAVDPAHHPPSHDHGPPSSHAPHHHSDAFAHSPAGIGTLQTFAALYHGPVPSHENVLITVPLSSIDTLAKSVWTETLAVLYPDGTFSPQNIITEDKFVKVCEYLLKARIDYVYSSVTGRRPSDRIPLSASLPVPRSIVQAISCFGTVTIQQQSIVTIPAPPAPDADSASRIGSQVSFNDLQAFSKLVTLSEKRGVFTTEFISRDCAGTPAWLLTSRDTATRATIATADTRNVSVWAQFSEWTPADAILSAFMATGYDGHAVFPLDDFLFVLPSIVDVATARLAFAVNA